MYRSDELRIKIEINLENGLYAFDGESATGKTRLFRCLRDLQFMGDKILTYTYSDKLNGISLADKLKEKASESKVIMLDRYDMYLNEEALELLKYSEDRIILVDCKLIEEMQVVGRWCTIEMTESSIVVKE